MEPSKNIVRGMLAFEELLVAHPEWRGEVVHLAFAYPSRQGLAEYLAYGADVVHTAERINHMLRLGRRDGWTPSCSSVEDDRARSLAALADPDVLLVNPVRDGLNLVAKEGPLLSTADGVLVLSHEAGAWRSSPLTAVVRSGSTPSTSWHRRGLQSRCTMPPAAGPAAGALANAPCAAGPRRLVGGPAWRRPPRSGLTGAAAAVAAPARVRSELHGAGGPLDPQVGPRRPPRAGLSRRPPPP